MSKSSPIDLKLESHILADSIGMFTPEEDRLKIEKWGLSLCARVEAETLERCANTDYPQYIECRYSTVPSDAAKGEK